MSLLLPGAGRTLAALAMLTMLAGCGADQANQQPGHQSGTQQPKSTSRAVAGAEQLAACPTTSSRPPVTNALPDVTLPCLGQGPDIRLADLRGPLLVNVWAQWCTPCRDEAPYLAELQRKAGGKVQLLGIDYDDPRADQAVKFATQHRLDYPQLVDTDKQIQRPLKIGGPPLTAFVGKTGAVVYVHHGVFKSQQELDQLVKDKLGVTW